MKLLKRISNGLHTPYWESRLLQTDYNTWIKEIKINDSNFDAYDIDTLKKFIDKFDCIAKPISLEYDNTRKFFKYELKDYSHCKFLVDLPYFEQITVLKNIIQIIHDFVNYSRELGFDNIFCYNDFNMYNIFVEDGKIILIDFDSFRWMTINDFHKFFQYTMIDLSSKFGLEKL